MSAKIISKKKIGVHCEPSVSEEEVLASLIDSGEYNPIFFDTYEELIADYKRGKTFGIVYGINKSTPERLDVLDRLIEAVGYAPIIVLARSTNEAERNELSDMGNIFVLKYPDEIVHLDGVFKKMFAAQPVLIRLDDRRRVNLRVEFMKDDIEGSCILTDISHGGASGVVTPGFLREGDFVKIHLPLFKYVKDQWIAAQVVWEGPCSQEKTKRFGLSFAV